MVIGIPKMSVEAFPDINGVSMFLLVEAFPSANGVSMFLLVEAFSGIYSIYRVSMFLQVTLNLFYRLMI